MSRPNTKTTPTAGPDYRAARALSPDALRRAVTPPEPAKPRRRRKERT